MSIAEIAECCKSGKEITSTQFMEFMVLLAATVAECAERIAVSKVSWKDDQMRKLSRLFFGDPDWKAHCDDVIIRKNRGSK